MEGNIKTELDNPFAALSEQRKIIADLHERLGGWLNKFNRYVQLTEDCQRQEKELMRSADFLVRDVEVVLDRTKNDNLDNVSEAIGNSETNINDLSNESNFSTEIELVENSKTSETEIKNKDMLKGLPIFDALKKYLTVFPEEQTVKQITDGLIANGFDAKVKHLYESIRSTLRYYEKKGVFERNGADWKLGIGKRSEDIRMRPEIGPEIQSKTSAETEIIQKQKSNGHQPINPTVKSNTEYCREILLKSGQPWLHIDQFLVILKNDYGIIRRKEIVAAALRKNAKSKNKIFKLYGGNRFGLYNVNHLPTANGISVAVAKDEIPM